MKIKERNVPDNMYHPAHDTYSINEDGYEYEFANYGEGLEPLGLHSRENPNHTLLKQLSQETGIPIHPNFGGPL
jgi:hypothetical protein